MGKFVLTTSFFARQESRHLADSRSRNLGVLQTTVSELITVKEHQGKLPAIKIFVSLSPFSDQAMQHAHLLSCRLFGVLGKFLHQVAAGHLWGTGIDDKNRSIVGPMIGGALAKPVDAFPSIFVPGSIWDRYPYLLPNLFSAVCVFCGLVIGLLFLEETHSIKKLRRDPGVELGNRLLSHIPWNIGKSDQPKSAEEEALLEPDEQLPGYRTTENSPLLASTSANSDPVEPLTLGVPNLRSPADQPRKMPTRIFTRQVVLIIVTFGILAL